MTRADRPSGRRQGALLSDADRQDGPGGEGPRVRPAPGGPRHRSGVHEGLHGLGEVDRQRARRADRRGRRLPLRPPQEVGKPR